MKLTLRLSILCVILLASTVSCSPPAPTSDEVKALETMLKGGEKPAFVGNSKDETQRWKTLLNFYENRQFRPVRIARNARQPIAADLDERSN